MIYQFILTILIFILCLIYFRDILKKDYSQFIKNTKKNCETIFNYWLIVTFVFGFINIISPYIFNVHNHYQDELNGKINAYILIAVVILAPLIEEAVFRVFPTTFIKNKYFYFIISSIAFSSLHFLGGNVLALLPYFAFGIIMCHLYLKEKNLIINIATHTLYNSVVMIMTNLMLLLK